MKKLRKLGAAVILSSVLALSAFAGEMPTPPCAPPVPGEMPTPPCATQPSADDSAALGDISTPPASSTIDLSTVAEAAINLLLLY
jgi:hypothetical protein